MIHFKIEMMEHAVRGEKFSYADEAFAFIEELDRLTAPDAVMDAMQKSLSLFGFDNFIMTCLPGPREKFEQAVLMRKWPKGWFELYATEDYVRVDPVIHHCRNTVQPFEWKDAPIHENAGPRALEVMNRAVDYGMKEGFCLPVHGINGYEACLSMSGKALDISSRTKPALHLMSMYAFERIRTHVSRASAATCQDLNVARKGDARLGRRRQIGRGYGRHRGDHGAYGYGSYRQRLPKTSGNEQDASGRSGVAVSTYIPSNL